MEEFCVYFIILIVILIKTKTKKINIFGPDKNNCIDFEHFIKFMSNDFENSFAKDPTAEKRVNIFRLFFLLFFFNISLIQFDPNNPKDLLELTVAFARIDVNR